MEERGWFNLINLSVQLRLLFILVSAILFNTLLLGGFIWYCVDLLVYDLSFERVVEGLNTQIMGYGLTTAGAVIVAAVLFCLVLIRETHRLVGPIYRIKQELRKIHETGSVHPISVRSNDHFQDLVKELNLVLLDLSNSSNEN